MTLTVYGDTISGNCLKVKFVCDRLKLSYRWVETSVLNRETRTPHFLAMNPVGEVPIIVTDDGKVLAQSNAIIVHLAEGSDLIPSSSFERALMFQWLFWEQYSHEKAIAVRRFHKTYLKKSDAEIDPSLMPNCEIVLTVMENHLRRCQYFVGNDLTLADIALVAYTRLAHEADLDLKKWPLVRRWVLHIEDELGLGSTVPN